MMKRIAISAVVAGGLFSGVLAAAGAAHADYDADSPYYGPVPGHYDAGHYGSVPGRYDAGHYGPVPGHYDARCYGMPADRPGVFIGPDGVKVGVAGGGTATFGPGGVGYEFGC